MPAKIHYPKNNKSHKQKLLIAQGKCDDSTRITVTLTKNGTAVNGQQLQTNHAKSWAFKYQNLGQGNYTLKIDQRNSPAIASSDIVIFPVDPPSGPIPITPPIVMTPLNGDTLTAVFFPMGTTATSQAITKCLFQGNGHNIDALGTVLGPDANGGWSANVDASACPAGGGYSLTVGNAAGDTVVNNLTL